LARSGQEACPGNSGSDVAAALARENVELPGGRIEEQTKEYSDKVKGEFPNAQDFNELIVAWFPGGPGADTGHRTGRGR
jgi:multidrug efflux pump subunit AcrB